MFRTGFRRFRCALPASGFYEWRAEGGKRPNYITAADGSILLIAGLWDKFDCLVVDSKPAEALKVKGFFRGANLAFKLQTEV